MYIQSALLSVSEQMISDLVLPKYALVALTGINSEIIGSGLLCEKPMDLDSTDYRVHCQDLETDAELFRAMKAGQSSGLGVLYDRYASLVYRLALRILTNPQEAEDLTQEIFLILWRSGTYNQARGSLGSFLTTLTRSRAIDKLRSRGSNLKFIQRWSQMMATETSPPTPFESASLNQRSHFVQSALAQLPEKQRQVLEMAYYEGLSQSEIAKNLDIPLGTIKTWSRQGLLNTRQKDVIAMLQQPNTQLLSLKGMDQASAASGNIVLTPGEPKAVLILRNLPVLPKGQFYQLWSVVNGEKIPWEQFNANKKGAVFVKLSLPSNFEMTDLVVTVEVLSAPKSPAGPMVMSSNL